MYQKLLTGIPGQPAPASLKPGRGADADSRRLRIPGQPAPASLKRAAADSIRLSEIGNSGAACPGLIEATVGTDEADAPADEFRGSLPRPH